MGNDADHNLAYWIAIKKQHKAATFKLRKWAHLKIAFDDNLIWIRGLNEIEIQSTEVLQIPSIKRYYLKETKLIPFGKKLFELIEPNLLWSPIGRGLQIELPKENFNYFGLKEKHKMSLIKSNEIKPIMATKVTLYTLEQYMHSAIPIRFKNLQWTILADFKALIIGSPILPIQGEDYYQDRCFLIPAGWKFKYSNLVDIYKQSLVNRVDYWYVLDEQCKVYKINKDAFVPLSKGSLVNTKAL